MHELAICQGLIREVARVAAGHGAARVKSVTVTVGPLSGVETAALEAAFPIARAGSVASDAALIVETSEISIRCKQCGSQSAAPINRLVCGACGHSRVQILSGDELLLKSIELSRDVVSA